MSVISIYLYLNAFELSWRHTNSCLEMFSKIYTRWTQHIHQAGTCCALLMYYFTNMFGETLTLAGHCPPKLAGENQIKYNDTSTSPQLPSKHTCLVRRRWRRDVQRVKGVTARREVCRTSNAAGGMAWQACQVKLALVQDRPEL